MIKFYFRFLIVFLLFSDAANGQLIPEVIWVKKSSLKPAETIYYDSARKLNWKDFQGKPDTAHPAAAMTGSGFGYSLSFSSGPKGTLLRVEVFCFFRKKESWVKPGKQDDYLLNHEQRHFDITWLTAREFADSLKSSSFTLEDFSERIKQMYESFTAGMRSRQDDYDLETENGIKKEAQQLWDIKIGEGLIRL